jgi:hypothetical protein
VRCPIDGCDGRIEIIGGKINATGVSALGRCSVCHRELWDALPKDSAPVKEIPIADKARSPRNKWSDADT